MSTTQEYSLNNDMDIVMKRLLKLYLTVGLICLLDGESFANDWLKMNDETLYPMPVTSMRFAEHVFDAQHAATWKEWTVEFGGSAPKASLERGPAGAFRINIDGVKCTYRSSAPVDCELALMVTPAGPNAPICAVFPVGQPDFDIDCPSDVEFGK